MDRPLQILSFQIPPLYIPIKASRIQQYYCAAVILLSWLAIALAALPLLVNILLMVAAGMHGVHVMRQLRILPVHAVEYRNGDWFLRIGDVSHAVTLDKQYFLAYGILSLLFHFRSGKHLRVVLWPDSADADNLRRLRATLLAR
jgi:hypothetical protein